MSRNVTACLCVVRGDEDVFVAVSARVEIENRRVYLREVEADTELSAAEHAEAEDLLTDAALCY